VSRSMCGLVALASIVGWRLYSRVAIAAPAQALHARLNHTQPGALTLRGQDELDKRRVILARLGAPRMHPPIRELTRRVDGLDRNLIAATPIGVLVAKRQSPV
jgi:hypothetical protein